MQHDSQGPLGEDKYGQTCDDTQKENFTPLSVLCPMAGGIKESSFE